MSKLKPNISMIASIFPRLTFNNFNMSSDNNSGFCDKLGFKSNSFYLFGHTIKIQKYSFEGIEIKFNFNKKGDNQIIIQNAQLSVQVLNDDSNAKETEKIENNSNVLINHLDIEIFKEEVHLFTIKSTNSKIAISNNLTFVKLPSCNLTCRGHKIIDLSDIEMSYEKERLLVNSNYCNFFFPIDEVQFLLTNVYSVINNLSLISLTFTKADILINKDTSAQASNMVFKIEKGGQFSFTFSDSILNLSSYKFNLIDFELNENFLTIKDVSLAGIECKISSMSKSEGKPFIHGVFNRENLTSLKIDVQPFTSDFSLRRFRDFSRKIISKSFIEFITTSPFLKILTIEFLDVSLNVKIDEFYVFHVSFNLSYSEQSDLLLISSTRLRYHFNDHKQIAKDQIFQYYQKKIDDSGEKTVMNTIVFSPMIYNFSIDEIIPFFTFVKKMSKPIYNVFFKGVTKIDLESIQIYIGQTYENFNEHSESIQIKIDCQPIIITNQECRIFSTSFTFSLKSYNNLTSFWDQIIEPLNIQLVSKFGKNKSHLMVSTDEEFQVNLTTQFLSSLTKILKNSSTAKMPIALVSNYTNSLINAILNEPNNITVLEPMTSHQLTTDTFYVINSENKKTKFHVPAITSRTFIKNDLFIDIDIKDGTKNIYFMNIWSVENQLGMDIQLLYKVKRSFTNLMNLRYKEKRGFSKSAANYTLNFMATPLIETKKHQTPSSPSVDKHDQSQTFTPKKYKSIPYTIKGVEKDRDVDCIIYLGKEASDKTKIMIFYPRYEIENRLPFQVSFNFKHCKAITTVVVEPFKKKPVLMPFDINQQFQITAKINEKESHPTLISLKLEPFKPIDYELSFEKCQFKLNVSIGDVIPIIRFALRSPTIVFNRSSHSFLINNIPIQKAKQYSLPHFESESYPALFIENNNDPQIEIPATSEAQKIHILCQPFVEYTEVMMLKMKASESLFTPLKMQIKRDPIKGNLIYLYDFIKVKNSTNRTIHFFLENEFNSIRLKFDPGDTSPIFITNEDKSFNIEIEGFKKSPKIYLSNSIDTVIRFFNDSKLNRMKKKGEFHLRMTISNKNDGENLIEFSEVFLETAPYLISNDTDHILYAQQTDEWLPLSIAPRSTTIYSFDDPFKKPIIVLTIEGKSVECNLSTDLLMSKYSFNIGKDTLNLSVKTNKRNQRVVCVSDQANLNEFDHFISILIPGVFMTLIRSNQSKLMSVFVNQIQFTGKAEDGTFNLSSSIKSIQIEDESDKLSQGIILSSAMNKPDANFFSLNGMITSASRHLNLQQLNSLSISFSQIDIQINSDLFSRIRKFVNESEIKTFKMYLNKFQQSFINASIFSVSPISLSFFFRKNNGENQNGNTFLAHILPIQVPSLMNFTLRSVMINNISCKLDEICNLLHRIYSRQLINYVSLATGQPILKESVRYPNSQFENVTLSLSNQVSSDSMSVLTVKETLTDEMTLEEFERIFSESENENRNKQFSTIEIGQSNAISESSSDKIVQITENNNNNNNINNNNGNGNLSDISGNSSLENINTNNIGLPLSPSKESMPGSSSNFNIIPQSSANLSSPLLSLFSFQASNNIYREDFQLLRDDPQINNAYATKQLKRIENHKLFQLNRIEPVNMNAYFNAIAATKKKKTPLYFQCLSNHKQYLVVFDDAIDVVENDQLKMNIPFISIIEFTNEKNIVKITVQAEKPKLPHKVIELKFDTQFNAETAMNEMISRLMMMPNK